MPQPVFSIYKPYHRDQLGQLCWGQKALLKFEDYRDRRVLYICLLYLLGNGNSDQVVAASKKKSLKHDAAKLNCKYHYIRIKGIF